MNIKAISFIIIASGVLFGGSSQAFADTKWYAAAECERWNELTDPATFLNYSRRYNSSATKRLRLDCPSIQDRRGNIAASQIRVIDRHPADKVCARIVAVRHLGSSFVVRNGAAKCTGWTWNSPNSVPLNTGALFGVWSDMHFYHSVYRIPAKFLGRASGVVSYFVNEVNGFD